MQEPKGKMEFFYQYGEDEGSVKVTLPADAALEEALEGFETFLLAAGYVFDGQIEINGNIVDSDFIDPNAGGN